MEKEFGVENLDKTPFYFWCLFENQAFMVILSKRILTNNHVGVKSIESLAHYGILIENNMDSDNHFFYPFPDNHVGSVQNTELLQQAELSNLNSKFGIKVV